jgi:hypothetical protein
VAKHVLLIQGAGEGAHEEDATRGLLADMDGAEGAFRHPPIDCRLADANADGQGQGLRPTEATRQTSENDAGTTPTDLYGYLAFRVTHPTEDVKAIARLFPFETTRTWARTDFLNRGPNLPPLMREEYLWETHFRIEERYLNKTLEPLLSQMRPHILKLSKFVAGGGRIELDFQLHGALNSGAQLNADCLQTIWSMGAELEFEVFPKMNR